MNIQNDAHEQINNALNWRYATKAFDPTKKLKDGDLNAILETARLSPSSFGLQPWKFLVIENPELRESIKANAWGQTQVTDASHLIVFAASTHMNEDDITKFIQKTAEVQGTPPEALNGYKEIIKGSVMSRSEQSVKEWNIRQTYIALGFALEAAALMGIDACPMEGFDNAKINEILGLEAKGLTSVALMPVGYRSADDAAQNRIKVRYSFNEVVERM